MKRAALPSSRDQIHLLLACLLGSCCGVLLLLVGLALLPRQPIRSTPDLTLLLLSGVIGASGGLIVFLRRELWEPLKQLLKALPRRISSTRTLVIDDGVAPLQLLAHRINVLLAELKRNATEQREQVETLAHDIRGPLTRLLMRVETLGQQEQHDPELVAGLEADLEALISLDQQLAELSAPMHRPIQREQIALDPLCRGIARSYEAGLVGVQIAPTLTAWLDPRLLQRALHNLIDNALEHGAPPVLIRAEVRAEGPLILVDDHGCSGSGGKPPPQTHQRLGWVIVRRFCQSHGGDLAIGPSPLGGL
ncbi:MAG: HAMP domain-containing histidine kinase [Cyanobacteria bacterium K_DeepCast_35m_m1_288]|nr:HAMP domain-containing histidine kinase [Cyanobacteria bacterium K_DeepCast_35m_m1_288]